MLFPHEPHYTRKWIVDTVIQTDELVDSRKKLLITFHDNSSEKPLQTLVDPQLWFNATDTLIHTIPKYLPAPCIFQQVGPTCGLYALKIVEPTLEVDDLLERAQELNMTVAGEMFCVHELAELASRFGLSCVVISVDAVTSWFASNVQEQRQGCVLIPFDSDASGISFRQGANAHWGVVWNIWRAGDEMACLTTHSSAFLPSVERWSELRASNLQLNQARVRVDSQWTLQLNACCLAGWAVWVQKTKK